MSTSSFFHWQKKNLDTLLFATEYISQCLKNKLEDKILQPLSWDKVSSTSALATLCRIFSLSEFERDVILLCTALEIDPDLAPLCAEIQGNPHLNYPTFALTFATFPQASLSVLSAQNPLQYWRLIEFGTGLSLSQTPLRIEPRILSYLLGEKAFDDRLLSITRPFPPHLEQNPLAPSQEEIVARVANIWSEFSSSSPTIQLCGEEATAQYTIALAVSIALNYSLHIMSASVLTQSFNDNLQLQRRWSREALLSNSLLFLDCNDIVSDETQLELQISQFVEHLETPIILGSQRKISTKHNDHIVFDTPRLSDREQAEIWKTYLGKETNQFDKQISQLVSQFNLSNAIIQTACQQFEIFNLEAARSNRSTEILDKTFASPASKLKDTDSQNKSPFNRLWDFCRHQARPKLEGLAQRIDTSATWNDLVLSAQQLQILQDIATHLQQRAKVYQEWGFANKSSRGLGISALFYGESGTGKTMAAEVLANELHLDLYRIDLSAVVSKYIGETEKNLGRIFAAAETGGGILLFDEADALFGKRTEVQDSHDRHANVEVSYLLQRIEAYQGLAILTTNHKNALDSAFLRRIRFFVEFFAPDTTQRTEIWRRVFPQQTPTQDLDYQKLGQLKVTGGNIRNIALNAAFLAANAEEPVMMKHILQAAKREYLKLKRLLTDEEIKDWN